MNMILIKRYQKELDRICRARSVNELYVFGSILSDRFNDDSDIDFLVSINSTDPIEYAENYFELKFELEDIFGRAIDLLEEKALKNRTFMEVINKQKLLVYESSN